MPEEITTTKIALFKGKKIRKVIHNNEWWFSIVDVIESLTDSPTPRQYWGEVKQREFTDLQLSPIWVQLKLESSDGKKYETDCANTEGIFRIIQSIPSPRPNLSRDGSPKSAMNGCKRLKIRSSRPNEHEYCTN